MKRMADQCKQKLYLINIVRTTIKNLHIAYRKLRWAIIIAYIYILIFMLGYFLYFISDRSLKYLFFLIFFYFCSFFLCSIVIRNVKSKKKNFDKVLNIGYHSWEELMDLADWGKGRKYSLHQGVDEDIKTTIEKFYEILQYKFSPKRSFHNYYRSTLIMLIMCKLSSLYLIPFVCLVFLARYFNIL